MIKKLIAPIIVTVVLVAYFIGWLVFFYYVPEIPVCAKIIGTAVPLLLIGVSIAVLLQRIHEIRKGEENDLSKY